jgi:hypothetical protein
MNFPIRIFLGFLSIVCVSHTLEAQEIRLVHKEKEGKSRVIRVDKPVMVRTFEGLKFKGEFRSIDRENIVIGEATIPLEDIMTLAGNMIPSQKNRTVGLGMTIGAGLVLPVALYYILGGIAWAQPNGIFVGATLLAFDLLLAYAGTSLMGIYPRRFSTLNWQVEPINMKGTDPDELPLPLPLPLPRPTG